MKKIRILPIILAVCIIMSMSAQAVFALDEPSLGAQAVLLIDLDSGRELYSKNADEVRAPASLTKIMTILVALDALNKGKVSLNDMVTAQSDCRYGLDEDSSTSGISAGEVMSFKDLLYCAMIHSANEACNVIASYISGNVPAYVEEMNSMAARIGCTNTHFANTNGLPAEGHYSTARDMSIITMAAMEYPMFMEICNTVTYTVAATNYSAERVLDNSNALISANGMYGGGYLYEGASGVKTGYTRAAGYCLVSTAAREGMNFLAVVMGCDGVLNSSSSDYGNFVDSIKLYNWAFGSFEYQVVQSASETITEIQVAMADDDGLLGLKPRNEISVLLPKDYDTSDVQKQINVYNEKLVAPIEAGTVLGEMSLSLNGESLGSVKLIAAKSVDLSKREYMKNRISDFLDNNIVKVVIAVLIVLLVLYIALVIRYRYLRRKHLKARKEAERRRREELRKRRAARAAMKTGDTFDTDNYKAVKKHNSNENDI